MTDSKHHDLRTRIAATICDWYNGENVWAETDDAVRDEWKSCADAVIAALGLEPQVHYDPDCEFYRYVTDWIDPQNNQRVDLP